MKFHFISSHTDISRQALRSLVKIYGQYKIEECNCIVALGGDGLMLSLLHQQIQEFKINNILPVPVFGMNRGSVGFLMNNYREEDLGERISQAVVTNFRPLHMHCYDYNNNIFDEYAINDVSVFRDSGQTSHLEVIIDGKVRIEKLVGDGLLISTPAGSTAYNRSVGGPIIPVYSDLLAITPINCYSPRRWKGGILPDNINIRVKALDTQKRPVSVTADSRSYKNIYLIEIKKSKEVNLLLLHDTNHSLDDRIMDEIFL